jgi:glyoxylase-like metal-dependent hydrolase (beta-lactamase superfamily II)
MTIRALAFAVAAALTPLALAAERPSPTRTEVAPGVYLFSTPSYGDVGLDGNSIAVLSDEGVFVFDTNGTPAAAASVLSQIRALTDKPVRYIANSHWHWDHWYGTETYTAAFPNVQVIAHEDGRTMMAGPALEFNRPGLEQQLPAYIGRLQQRVDGGDAKLKPILEEDRFFLDQKKNVHHVLPTVTFSDRMSLHLGGRDIELLHLGRGVTPGDAMAYLPKERLLLAGDVLVNPITFALSGYPTEWLHVLERIDQMDVAVIVTGHGAPLRDKSLLHDTMDVFRVLLRDGRAAKARGLDPDQAKAEILPRLHDVMVRMTHDDAALNNAFASQLVDWYLHRVYDELDGKLTNAIAPIPAK